jgi:mRNA interferase MazF
VEIWRGDVIEYDFGRGYGSEQGGKRPAVVVQNDVGNKYSPTTIVFPLTSSTTKKKLPTHGTLYAEESTGLDFDSTFLAEQPVTIDKARIISKRGSLTPKQMALVDTAILVSFGLRMAMQRMQLNVPARVLN